MLAWYDDINSLIDKTADERNAFVTRHKRSMSTGSARSVSSDGGLEEDEADQVPFSAAQSVKQGIAQQSELPSRPSPGGRFPSDLQVDRSLQRGPSSGSSSEVGLDLATAAGGFQIAHASYPNAYDDRTPMDTAYGPGNPYEYHPNNPQQQLQQQTSYYANNAPATPGQSYANDGHNQLEQSTDHPVPYEPYQSSYMAQQPLQQEYPSFNQNKRVVSNYGEWMAPAAGGMAVGALGVDALHHQQQRSEQKHEEEQINAALAEASTENRADPGALSQTTPHEQDGSAIAREAFVGVPNPVVATTAGTEADEPSNAHQLPATTPALDAAEEGKLGNGEPAVGHMGVKRTDTGFSVSDLHVPGEYPKTRGA